MLKTRVFHNTGEACYIPVELVKGDKVMIVSHDRVVGVTDVKMIDKDMAILTKTIPNLSNRIPKKIHSHGFIASQDIFDIFHYDVLTCKTFGFRFLPFYVQSKK